MRFSFRCDCTYESRVRVFLVSIRESGTYSVAGERLSFARASGETTTWPFRFEGDQKLLLEESAGETHVYQRSQQRNCSTVPTPP